MARKADQDAQAKAANEVAMSKIEAAAKKQYQQDRKAAEAAAGSWTWDADSSYYYNATHRWYYDPKTQWYYGGEPTPEWSQSPPLPAAAMFGVAAHEGGPVPQDPPSAAAAAGSAGGGASTSGRPDELPFVTKTVQRALAVPKHPLADVGGYRAPTTGRVGGGMGAGVVMEGANNADPGAKRKREEPGKQAGGKGGATKGVSKEEAEAQARREAARQRVAQRTAAGFGYL